MNAHHDRGEMNGRTESATARLAEDELNETGGDEPAEPSPTVTPGEGNDRRLSRPSEEDPNRIEWDGPDDPKNPQNWSRTYKWWLTLLVSTLTLNATFASSAPSSAINAFTQDFHVSREVSELVTSMFLLGYVFGPFIWAPGSELFGRRPVFLVTLAAYCLLQIGEALAKNMQTLLVIRFLAGLFASSPITNSGGVISDIWDAVGRGPAMSIFSASVFLGPITGPFIGGFLTTSRLTWRWIFWIMMIIAGACWVLVLFFLPETFAPVLLSQKARRIRKQDPSKSELYAQHDRQDWSPKSIFQRTVFRPFHMLALEPILLAVTIYLSIVYGLLYGLFEAFPLIWLELRGFSPGLSGLIFVGIGIGSTAGAITNIFLSRPYKRLTPLWKGSPPPEYRLYGAMLSSPFLVVGIFFLGWTGAFKSVPWYVPALATPIIGMSFTLVFISFLSYIVEVYLMYAASGLAASTIVRSAVAAAFPLFTVQMFEGLGIQWACTFIGCIAIVLAPIPIFFFKYGSRLREKSRFAPCVDLKIAKELEAEKKGEA